MARAAEGCGRQCFGRFGELAQQPYGPSEGAGTAGLRGGAAGAPLALLPQVNLDFESERDMVDKFRIGLALQARTQC